MPLTLTDYRSDLDNLLATAVDASTWTDAIFDQSLRMALAEINVLLVYEDSFTVVSGGYEQDLSGITDIASVVAVAYPWVEGRDFVRCLAAWRLVGHNQIYFTVAQPATGETIRVRYSKLHKITDLDSAASTTVPDAYRVLLGLWAAAYACELRVRQVSENPALPKEAAGHLQDVAVGFRRRAQEMVSHVPTGMPVRWGGIGL